MGTDPQPATTAVPNADWNPAWAIGRLEALRAKLIERHPEAAADAELTALFQGVRDELGMVTVAPPAGQDVVYGNWTREELIAAFARVRPPLNWKNHIDVVIADHGENDHNLIDAAVIFFTGGPATFDTLTGGRVRVTAPGYYTCIGS